MFCTALETPDFFCFADSESKRAQQRMRFHLQIPKRVRNDGLLPRVIARSVSDKAIYKKRWIWERNGLLRPGLCPMLAMTSAFFILRIPKLSGRNNGRARVRNDVFCIQYDLKTWSGHSYSVRFFDFQKVAFVLNTILKNCEKRTSYSVRFRKSEKTGFVLNTICVFQKKLEFVLSTILEKRKS